MCSSGLYVMEVRWLQLYDRGIRCGLFVAVMPIGGDDDYDDFSVTKLIYQAVFLADTS